MLETKQLVTIEDCVRHWPETVRMVERHEIVRTFEEELDLEIALKLPVEDSPLDHGYYVYGILQAGTCVHVGFAKGGSDICLTMLARYQGDALVIFGTGLQRRQARYQVVGITRKMEKKALKIASLQKRAIKNQVAIYM